MDDDFTFQADSSFFTPFHETSLTTTYVIKVSITDPNNRTVNALSVCNIPFYDLNYFATVTANECAIYGVNNDKTLDRIQKFVDDNVNESFICCDWMVLEAKKQQAPEVYLVVGSTNGGIKILNLVDMVVSGVLVGHQGAVQCLKLLKPHSPIFFSGSSDGTVRIWNVITQECIRVIQMVDGFTGVHSLDIGIRGDRFICCDTKGTVAIYQQAHDQSFVAESIVYTDHGDSVWCVGKLLLGLVNGCCTLYSTLTVPGEDRVSINILKQYGTSSTPKSFCVNYDASILATICDTNIEFFEIDKNLNAYASFSISELDSPPTKISFCGKKNSLIVVTRKNTLVLLNPQIITPESLQPQLTLPFFSYQDDNNNDSINQDFTLFGDNSLNLMYLCLFSHLIQMIIFRFQYSTLFF